MQSGLHLFSRMYIACQAASGDRNTLFEHENHYWPLSLAENNLMRFGEKSDLLKCLETLTLRLEAALTVEVKYMMGCSCSCFRSKDCDNKFRNIFRDYANYHDHVYVPYLRKQLDYVKRMDIVWDTLSDSLKAHARENRYFFYN